MRLICWSDVSREKTDSKEKCTVGECTSVLPINIEKKSHNIGIIYESNKEEVTYSSELGSLIY